MEKQKFYRAKWFLWVCLIFLPPIGLILLWACHKQMKNATRIILSVVFALWFVILVASRNGAKDGVKDGLAAAGQPTATPQVTQEPAPSITSTPEPELSTTPASVQQEISESEIAAIKAMIEDGVKSLETQGINYEVVYTENAVFMLNVWQDGLVMDAILTKEGNDEAAMKQWESLKEGIISLSKTIQDKTSTLTEAYVVVGINILNDADTDMVLLGIANGVVFYDVMDE